MTTTIEKTTDRYQSVMATTNHATTFFSCFDKAGEVARKCQEDDPEWSYLVRRAGKSKWIVTVYCKAGYRLGNL